MKYKVTILTFLDKCHFTTIDAPYAEKMTLARKEIKENLLEKWERMVKEYNEEIRVIYIYYEETQSTKSNKAYGMFFGNYAKRSKKKPKKWYVI